MRNTQKSEMKENQNEWTNKRKELKSIVRKKLTNKQYLTEIDWPNNEPAQCSYPIIIIYSNRFNWYVPPHIYCHLSTVYYLLFIHIWRKKENENVQQKKLNNFAHLFSSYRIIIAIESGHVLMMYV